MKASGIVRKIDELGRVVIPISFRQSMGLKPGDLVSVFNTENSNGIVITPAQVSTCAYCGTVIGNSHNYCSTCGKPTDQGGTRQ